MPPTADAALHYLVVDVIDDRPIFVFLGRDPGPTGPTAEPVHLEPLPVGDRFGRPGRPSTGRPVLGQARGGRTRFREFCTAEDLWEAGFLPVAHYRLCDTWDDYHDPWSALASGQETAGQADSSA